MIKAFKHSVRAGLVITPSVPEGMRMEKTNIGIKEPQFIMHVEPHLHFTSCPFECQGAIFIIGNLNHIKLFTQ